MNSKKFALIGGITMLAIGFLALIPALSIHPESLPNLNVEASYGYFLKIFPMNIFNKMALILFGIAGIVSSNYNVFQEKSLKMNTHSDKDMDTNSSIVWSKIVFYVMGVLAILGMFEKTNTLGDYWPLFGNEIWFHALFAVVGGYFGYIAHEDRSSQSLHRV